MTTIGSNFTIGQCVANLPSKFGNRQNLYDLTDPPEFATFSTGNPPPQNSVTIPSQQGKPVMAVVESIRELTETYEFEELKYQTPVPNQAPLSMTAGQPLIPISTLLATIQTNSLYPQFQNQNIVDITDVYTFWMWFAGGVNQAGRTLKYRRVPTIDTYSYGITNNSFNQLGVAPPVYATRFGNSLQVGPVPDQNYQYFVRMKLRHPFPIGGSTAFIPSQITGIVTAGVVTSITVSAGGGYPVFSTFPVIFPPSPTGAVASGTVTTDANGHVAVGSVITGGSGYTGNVTGTTAILSTQQVFMPDSWKEIVELCACQRLALWEGASEYISMFEELLQTKGIDIAKARARKAQMVRDELHNERSMSLMVGPYTWA